MSINKLQATPEGAGTFRKYLILGWDGVMMGWVSDPQNYKIKKVPGYQTKLGTFLPFLRLFNVFKYFRKYALKEDKVFSGSTPPLVCELMFAHRL